MDKSDETLTESELKKKAYLTGLRLKNSGLDSEAIYARLEKQGIPEEMAKAVVKDILIERKRDVVRKNETVYQFSLLRIGIGLAAAVISAFLFPGLTIVPVGIIAGGVVFALLAKRKMEK